jgi:hypothetical protein
VSSSGQFDFRNSKKVIYRSVEIVSERNPPKSNRIRNVTHRTIDEMRRQEFNINNLKVASPCSMSWEQMKGDERSRHCSLCELNVHNIAGLSANEVKDLITASEGRLCVRLFRRADGTVITSDCPVGLRKYRHRVAGIASAAFATVLSLMSVSHAQKDKHAKKVNASEVQIVRTHDKVGSSSIIGTITDPNGAVVPGAKLQLFQDGKEARPIMVSDADGRFSFEGLSEGTYEIGVSKSAGFQALRVQNIELKSDEKQEILLALSVDGTSVMIGVVAGSPLIDLLTNEQTTVFTRDMIDRIPGRRPFD